MREFWQDRTPQTEAGVRGALTLDAIRWQYLHGVPDESLVSPDTWQHDFAQVSRPGNDLVQLALFADYATNLPLYPKLHAWLGEAGSRCWRCGAATTPSSAPAGALAFAADAPGAEICLLDGGHFLLESHLDAVVDRVRPFLGKDPAVTGSLKDQTVLVIGRGGGLARAIALAAQDAGAQVVVAGRDQEKLSTAYAAEPGISTETVDLTDEASIAALGERLGSLDHVVSTASARARGRVPDLDRDAIRLSFDTKVIGPLMLAKHLAPRMTEGGSFTLFSGVAAAKIAVGTLGVAITNAAADTLARSLALELAPIRVNAISPGVIDTGAWDALGEQGKADYFADMSARNPARRIGTPEDIAQGVLFALTSTFLTGQTLHIDGGEPLT